MRGAAQSRFILRLPTLACVAQGQEAIPRPISRTVALPVFQASPLASHADGLMDINQLRLALCSSAMSEMRVAKYSKACFLLCLVYIPISGHLYQPSLQDMKGSS